MGAYKVASQHSKTAAVHQKVSHHLFSLYLPVTLLFVVVIAYIIAAIAMLMIYAKGGSFWSVMFSPDQQSNAMVKKRAAGAAAGLQLLVIIIAVGTLMMAFRNGVVYETVGDKRRIKAHIQGADAHHHAEAMKAEHALADQHMLHKHEHAKKQHSLNIKEHDLDAEIKKLGATSRKTKPKPTKPTTQNTAVSAGGLAQ